MRVRVAILLVVFLGAFHPTTVLAQWELNGAAVSTAMEDQSAPKPVSDGAGGVILTWYDARSVTHYDIYAQRIDASGVVQWTADGVALCTAANSQSFPTVVSDGAGGAIVTWQDIRSGTNYDIYAQRVNALGVVQWTANGVALCTAANDQFDPTIVSDGAGGAIVSWYDARSGTYDIYAQRISAAGAIQWTANGVALCTAASNQYSPTIDSDGAGGAIVTWYDIRSGTYDIYAQRVNALGAPQWTANGVALCTAANQQYDPTIDSDGVGGAIVTWFDLRGGADYDIYVQRINAAGAVQWTGNGVALCTAANPQYDPELGSDGAGGAIVTWYDNRSGTNFDIYAQRVNALGAPQWTADGVALCTAANDQYDPSIVWDDAGGAIVTWRDERSSTYDIYAQRINTAGAVQWTNNGVAVCTAANDQYDPSIVWDDAGGAIVTWRDTRSGTSDIYLQRVEQRYGYWGRPEPVLDSAADVPGDQGGRVRLNWYASGRDVLHQQVISHYSVWRATDEAAAALVDGAHVVDLLDVGKEFSGPVFRHEKTPTIDYFWELIGTQEAIYRGAYAFTAATAFDSTASGPAVHQFQIVAHAYDTQYLNWPSNVVNGYSIDNLAPAAPLLLIAQRVGADVNLKWNRAVAPDLRDYAIYRATSTGVTPMPINFLGSSDDTLAVDANAPGGALYYIVTAYDVHENQSAPSNEASVGALTDIGNTPAISSLTVLPNHPNPFIGTTELRVGLPADSDISIEVYDVAGRRVRSQTLVQQKAGWRTVGFDGRNDRGSPLSSGVYFYRVKANGKTVTSKMVIAR